MRVLIMVVCLLCADAAQAAAPGLPPATGKVVLTITGAVDAPPVELDMDGLESVGITELSTATPFTPGPVRFTGVLLDSLLTRVGAKGQTVRATALNDYATDLPLDEIRGYEVIVATRIDGRRLRVRDKGPLWVIYPWSQHPELVGPRTEARSVWQLRTLDVR